MPAWPWLERCARGRREGKWLVVMGIPMRVAVPWEWTAGWAADGERDCAAVRLRGQTPVACVAVVGKVRAGAS